MMASTIAFGDVRDGLQAGTINGPVQASFHYATARPETPPQPSIVIPFPRDPDFVERGTILEELCRKCAAAGSWTALVGLGGVGKSQLAIEHAYRTREQSSETWVLWVHASNASRYEQSFRDVADSVKLAGRHDPQANIYKLVHDWLRGCKHQWLLVLDNVDDASFLVERSTADLKTGARPLCEYLPRCERGSVIVTTRNKHAATKLIEQRDLIEVEPMDEQSALALLKKKLGTQIDDSKTAELATALEYMPLAIVQAAAYISQRAPRCSVEQYLDDFYCNENKKTSLLNQEAGQLRRDREANNSIIITWQISFDYLRQQRPSATDLLSLMSFFDRQGIPEELICRQIRGQTSKLRSTKNKSRWRRFRWLRRGRDKDSGFQRDDLAHVNCETEDDTFEDDVVALRNFCFVSVETGGSSFEMHALVQLATRTWLAANGELEYWKEQFISILSEAFPTGAYENWAVCGPLFAHAQAAAEQQPEDKQALVKWTKLMYHAAWYEGQRGNVIEAEKFAVASLKILQKVLGDKHKDTWWGIAMVADACWRGGQWDKAEKLQQQVMEIRTAKLGAEHPDTLISMNNLALTYMNQGRWKEAEELYVEVIKTSKANLGAEHPDTLVSMINLAFTWRSLGRGAEATALLRQCVELRRKVLGGNHPYFLSSQSALQQWEAEGAELTGESEESLQEVHKENEASSVSVES